MVFVGVFTVAGALRAGYDPVSRFVSELSIGPDGWVQRVNFLVTGVLLLVFAVAVRTALGRAVRALPIVLGVMAVCLAGSAAFDTDPSALFAQQTVHGLVHGLLGAVVFLGMPISCALVARAGRRIPRLRPLRLASLVVTVLLIVGIVLLKSAELPGGLFGPEKGVVQRVVLVLWFAWLAALSVLLLRGRRAPVAM